MRGDTTAFQTNLLDWFKVNQRRLPWRVERSVYKTSVSEFMLQQTQVDTVVPYFNRWLNLFPDFAALAMAHEEAVLKAWEGLGYYSRARNLHKLAKTIAESKVPEDVTDWKRMPGIGPYTAAAIASISQNIAIPVIDGNVIRVLSRLENDGTPVKSAQAAQAHFLATAEALLAQETPGDFNEAMMELGATVCLKSRPLCLLCPVKDHCTALAEGTIEKRPVIIRKSTVKHAIDRLIFVKNGKILLTTYPSTAKRLAGIAELPELPEILKEKTTFLLSRKRGISNQSITESFYTFKNPGELELNKNRPPKDSLNIPDTKWVSLSKIEDISLSAPHRKWLNHLIDAASNSRIS